MSKFLLIFLIFCPNFHTTEVNDCIGNSIYKSIEAVSSDFHSK